MLYFIWKKKSGIALVVIYVSADIKIFIEKCEVNFRVCESINQSYVSKNHNTREKKAVLWLIPDNISIKQEVINAADVGVNFYISQNSVHKSKNGIDWIFSGNRNKCKNLHHILDHDDDDVNYLNTRNLFTMSKTLYDNENNNSNNNNPVNGEEYDHRDDITILIITL